MKLAIQPILENENIVLYPLQEEDFEELYATASDPKIWEQHPNTDRWKREVFQKFFDGAIQSKGAFKIVDKASAKCIGSTRFYDYDEQKSQIHIGYTFYAVAFWGKGINPAVKSMMLDYIFTELRIVQFYVGANNIRSQIAMNRLGAKKVAEKEVSYIGNQTPTTNFVYQISKDQWKGA